MKSFTKTFGLIAPAIVWLLLAKSTSAAALDTSSTLRPGGFRFDRTISRPVLENYLSRSICIEGMLNGRGPLTDDIRMITNCCLLYTSDAADERSSVDLG